MLWTVYLLYRDVIGDLRDALGTDIRHVLVVVRVVADVSGHVLFLQPADAVHQTFGARQRPRPCQPLVALIWHERFAVGGRPGMLDGDLGQLVHVGNQPRLGAVGDVSVGQDDDRRHETCGKAPGFLGEVEAVARAARRKHRQRRFAVASEHRLQEIGLLGLGRQASARSTALDADDEHRQFEDHAQPHRLALQCDAGTARAGDRHRPAKGRPDHRAHRGDLVLRLEGADAEVLEGA